MQEIESDVGVSGVDSFRSRSNWWDLVRGILVFSAFGQNQSGFPELPVC